MEIIALVAAKNGQIMEWISVAILIAKD